MYANGNGVAKDDTRAAAFYSRACNANDALGCSNLGSNYWNGRGVPHDDSHAAALYSRACDANNAIACSNLSRRGKGSCQGQAVVHQGLRSGKPVGLRPAERVEIASIMLEFLRLSLSRNSYS